MSLLLDQYGNKFAHAASRNRRRGPLMRRPDRGVDQLIPMSDRKTLAAISRELVFNNGLALECIRQKATYSVGCAWLPSYSGSDAAVGEKATSWLENVWYGLCDVQGGCSNWWTLLELVSMAMDRDGEAFVLLTKNVADFPQIQHIPAYQIWSKSDVKTVEEGPYRGLPIEDGVITNGPRPVAYRVNKDPKGDEWEDVSARSLIHVFDRKYPEQKRGYPCFSHALDSIKNSMSSFELETIAQVIRSSIFLVEKTDDPIDEGDPRYTASVDTTNDTATISETTEPGIKRVSGDFDYDVVKHDNPGDIWENFQERIWGIAIVGAGWAKSLLIRSEKQGTAVRADEERARLAVSSRQKCLNYVAKRCGTYALATAPSVPTPGNLLKLSFTMPPILSVDDGRSARAQLEAWKEGALSTKRMVGREGLSLEQFYSEKAEDQIVATRVAREKSEKNSEGVTITPESLIEGRELQTSPPAVGTA